MDPLNVEALTHLKSVIQGLLPQVDPPAFPPELFMTQAQIFPAGISGIIGLNANPYGDIIGRRVSAALRISVKSDSDNNLATYFENTVNTLMSYGQGELLKQGILKLTMEKPGEPEKGDDFRIRDINIKVLFEYRKYPEAGDGIIESIPINVS